LSLAGRLSSAYATVFRLSQPALAEPYVPAELLDPVVACFQPRRVILFASVARGDAGPGGDVDQLVVPDDDAPRRS
jgi:hypothetical protein